MSPHFVNNHKLCQLNIFL